MKLNTPQEVIASTVVAFPVPSLAVQDGLQCLCQRCGHICLSGNRMKSHWIAKHGRRGNKSVDWRDVPIQTFFRGNLLRYFTESSPEKFSVSTNVSAAVNERAWIPYVDAWPQDLQDPPVNATLHAHYITSTCLTFSTPSTITFWRDVVPSLACTQPFLHYGLLALSSLHLSHTTSNSSHAISAGHYQSIAMRALSSCYR
jgi:hypothetical protein